MKISKEKYQAMEYLISIAENNLRVRENISNLNNTGKLNPLTLSDDIYIKNLLSEMKNELWVTDDRASCLSCGGVLKLVCENCGDKHYEYQNIKNTIVGVKK